MLRTDRDWIRGDQLLGIEYAEHVCFRIDFNGDISGYPGILAWLWCFRFGLIFNLVHCLPSGFAAGLDVFYGSHFECLNVRHQDLVARFNCFQLSWIELFKEMNVAVKFLGNCVGSIAIREEF